jgi:BMFP domain-containing protein YqiC
MLAFFQEGDETMSESNTHFFVSWAKERLDEMDATLTSLEGKVAEVQTDARDRADKIRSDLRKNRDAFRDAVKKLTGASEPAWNTAMTRLETEWRSFEREVKKYIESYDKQAELQQATFKQQATAQLNAWREAADKLALAAAGFTAGRRGEIETNVRRMKADALAAEEKLLKLNQAGIQSWSALTSALAETRAVFDRANHAAQEAFKRAS